MIAFDAFVTQAWALSKWQGLGSGYGSGTVPFTTHIVEWLTAQQYDPRYVLTYAWIHIQMFESWQTARRSLTSAIFSPRHYLLFFPGTLIMAVQQFE